MPATDAEFFELIQQRNVAAALATLAARPELCRARDTYLDSTRLHFAAHRGLTELVSALLEAGADRSARDGSFRATPAGWAEHGGHADIAALLQT